MLGGVRRSLPRFYLLDDRADSIHDSLVPILLLVGGFPAHDESPVGAGTVAHIGEAAQRAIDQIAHLNNPAGLMESAVKGVGAGAPASGNGVFRAVLASRSGGDGCQVGILDSGL